VVYFLLLKHGMIINAVLAVFNLLPIPPLDGSWLLKAVLPKKISVLQGRFHWLGLILILVAAQTGLLTILFYPVFVLIFMMEGLGGLVLAGLG
jgi:Zn-dependent protease